jgi:hypothetical protein
VVIKGKSVAGAKRLALHLGRKDTNERRNETIELRDVAAPELAGALREMEAVAKGCPNCTKPFYHASINTPSNERLSDEQRLQAIDRLEKELGFAGQPRVVVVHEKKDGREHCHVVWSRIRLDDMRTIHDGHNFRKHELVARDLEREFGHERVQGAHIERDGQPRPPRTPSHKEHQQGERTGVSAKQAKEHITALWRSTDNGKAFAEALKDSGWLLAKGDRRDFVAIDPRGGTHSLARRIEGATAKDIRARFADLDPRRLPSVAEARETQRARQEQRQRQTERAKAPPTPARAPERAAPAREAPSSYAKATEDRRARTGGGGAARGAGRALGGFGDVLFRLLMGESDAPSREPAAPARPPEPARQASGQEAERAPPPPPREPPRAPPEPAPRAQAPHEREEEERSRRRQELFREYGREVRPENERDAEIERERQRRGRERER